MNIRPERVRLTAIETALCVAFCVVVWVLVFSNLRNKDAVRDPRSHGCAHVGSDCGCLHRDECHVPCTTCCGPNGMESCFQNPGPEDRVK